MTLKIFTDVDVDLCINTSISKWIICMGGGTFSKVGGTCARWKESIGLANFVVWIGNCDVTSIEIWRHYLYTIWRYKLHYFRQNYTTMKTYRLTTWNSNRLLQWQPRLTASLGLTIRLFWLTKTVRRLHHWNFHLLSCSLVLSLLCPLQR